MDLDVNRGAEFGGKVPIYLDDNSARSFSVYFQEVVFADGQVWTGENENWTSLKQKTLEETFDPDLVEQYKRDTFSGAMYEPLINSDVWMCTCGTLNLAGDKNCCKCHNNREELLSALDQNTLADHLAAYTEKTTSESKEKRVKNIKKQVVSIVALVLILIAGFKSFKNGQEKATENAVVRALIGTSWDDGHYIFSDEHTITQKMRSWYVEGKYDTETRRWDVTELNGNVMRICITRYTEKYYYDVFFKKENGIVEIKSIKPLHSDGSGYGWSLIQDY